MLRDVLLSVNPQEAIAAPGELTQQQRTAAIIRGLMNP